MFDQSSNIKTSCFLSFSHPTHGLFVRLKLLYKLDRERYLAAPLPYVWGSDHKKQYVFRSCDGAIRNPWSCCGCYLEFGVWRTQSLRVDCLHHKQCGCLPGGEAVRSAIMGNVEIIVFGVWPIIWTTNKDLSFRCLDLFFFFFKSPLPPPATTLKSIQQSKNSNSA